MQLSVTVAARVCMRASDMQNSLNGSYFTQRFKCSVFYCFVDERLILHGLAARCGNIVVVMRGGGVHNCSASQHSRGVL
jgi:hypothetical protein